MSFLVYPTIKQAPILGMLGLGGGIARARGSTGFDYSAYSSYLTWQLSFKTNFNDASGNGYNISTSNISISSDYSKHYSNSAKFSGGASGTFSTDVWTAMNNGGNWTLEYWIYNASTSMQAGYGSNVLTSRAAGDNSNGWIRFGFGGLTGNVPRLRHNRSAGGFTAHMTDDGSEKATPSGEWIHVATSKSGSTVRSFYNGTLIDTDTDSGSIHISRGLIGGDDYGNFASFQTFYMQDLRLWTGSGADLYTADFTPPGAIE